MSENEKNSFFFFKCLAWFGLKCPSSLLQGSLDVCPTLKKLKQKFGSEVFVSSTDSNFELLASGVDWTQLFTADFFP